MIKYGKVEQLRCYLNEDEEETDCLDKNQESLNLKKTKILFKAFFKS